MCQCKEAGLYLAVLELSTTVTVLSWLTQARRFPEAEKETEWTQPPPPDTHTQAHKQQGVWLQRATGQERLNEHTLGKGNAPAPPNSASTAPNGILLPQGVGPGFSSTSFM